MNVIAGYVHAQRDRAVVERAVDECRLRGATLHLVSYVDVATGLNPQSVDASLSRAEAARNALDELAEEIRAEGVACTPHFVSEPGRSASAVLLEVAEQVDAGLVVVGVRRRTKVGKAFLGSSAQEVLLGSAAPVLAVKAAD